MFLNLFTKIIIYIYTSALDDYLLYRKPELKICSSVVS